MLSRFVPGLLALLAVLIATPAAHAAPGNPGVPGPPTVVFEEAFENVTNPALGQTLTTYTGPPPTSMTYTANVAWLNPAACNGIIGSYNSTTGATGCPASVYNGYIRPIARGMGAALGGGDDDQVMADVTIGGFPAPATPAATLETVNPVPLPSANRFVTFSIDAGAVTCQSAQPLLRFFLLDGPTAIPITNNAINACTDPRGQTVNGVRVGSYASDASIFFSGSSLGVRLTNDQTSGNGNDYAVDNLRVLDATPQLDKDFESPTVRGQPTTLTFTITNTSDLAEKEGWSFTDNLPAGLTVADQPNVTSTCANGLVGFQPNDTSVQVEGDLEAGEESCEITVDVVSPVPGTFENCAANISNLVGLDPPGCSTLTVEPASDLSITKTDDSGDGVADVGENLTYTIAVTNNGPDDSPGPITITDTLPQNVTYISDTAGCDTSALPVLTCQIGALDASLTNGFDVTVSVDQAAASSVLVNHAEVDGPNPDLNLQNNEDEVQTAVPPLSDLAITKTASADVADPGEQVTYTIGIENLGPDTSDPTTVTDTLPANVTYVSDTGGCNTSQLPVLTCDLGVMTQGASKGFAITVTVDLAAASSVLTNAATVEGSNPDQNPDNNTDDALVSVPPLSDLSITKTDSPDPVRPGGQITYTLEVTNDGPTDSDPTPVTDDLPDSLTLVSATPDQGSCGNTDPVSCDLGMLASGETAEITIVADVAADATGQISNTASVDGPNPDPDSDNDFDTATTQVAEADLSITKTDDPDPVQAGQDITYTLTVTNGGPEDATDVEVADDLPANLTLVSATPDQGTCNSADPIGCDLGTIANGASAEIVIVATVASDQAGGQVSNTASVDAVEVDPDPDDNEDTEATDVLPEADLAMTKTVGPSGRVRVGDLLTYTLTVTNSGPNDATGVEVTDEFANKAELVSVTPSQGTCGATQPIECDLGTIANGASATITVTARPLREGRIENSATTTSATLDPDLANNADEASRRVSGAKIKVAKRANRQKAGAGDIVTYEIVVSSRTAVRLENVKVCDNVPKQLDLIAAPGAKVNGNTACWRIDLQPRGERTLRLRAKVKPSLFPLKVENVARATGRDVAPERGSDDIGIKPAGVPGPGPCKAEAKRC